MQLHRPAVLVLSLLACLPGHRTHAQTLYQARKPTVGCVNPRATAALTGNDPRRGEPAWVSFVMRDGRCVQITPASRWALVSPGPMMLLRNVVPGTGAKFYVAEAELAAVRPLAGC